MASADDEPNAVFGSFEVSRYRFKAGDPADPGDPAKSFFHAAFGVRAVFELGAASNGVDLANDPIYVSFGSFAGGVGPDRSVTVTGDQVELRYAGRGLNALHRLYIKQTPGGLRLRLRAMRLNLAEPKAFTLQIGDDVGQIDLDTLTPIVPQSLVHGVVAARKPQAGTRSALVRMPCAEGTCRRTTDEDGLFEVESSPGDSPLTIDGSRLGPETMSLLVRRLTVRPGTNDAGLVVLPALERTEGTWIEAGTQAAAAILSYASPSGEVLVTIPAGASVEFADASQTSARAAISPVLLETLPVATPAGIGAASAFAVEPAGARISPCADLDMPNPLRDVDDGATVHLFALGDGGSWVPLPSGVVTGSGTRIRADGALCDLSTFFVGCVAELTTVTANVTFRGAKIARVPVFIQGFGAITSAPEEREPNVRAHPVVAGCLGEDNSLRAYAALPLTEGYLSGVSADVLTVAGAQTDLGDIALAFCGDGVVEGPEECDGTTIGASTCQDFGYEEGTIGCTPTCVFDVGRCRTCGDEIADSGEECDGPDDSICPGLCRDDCSCPPVCGDGVRNRATERCDGSDDVLCPNACNEDCTCPEASTPTTTLPPSDCPVELEITPVAHALAPSGESGFEIGTTGLGHDRDIAGGHPIRVALSCENESWPCGHCTIEGLARVDGRCANDPATECSAVGTADDACDGGVCDAFFLPPLHNLWGGGPSCFVERLTSDLGGFLDNESGAAELSATIGGDMYFGVSPTQPCPICVSDDTANDGEKDGKCSGGEFDGAECDANGIDPTFGATSFDCLPGKGMLGSAVPVTRGIDLSTDGDSLAFSAPCDFPLSGSSCPCAMCAGDPSIPCGSDADCEAAGTTGPCDERGAGTPRKPNACEGWRCADTGDGIHGECATGPDETYCDGMLFTHGTPFLPCLTNADCEAIDDACHGDCGECTIVKRRSCFLDPIATQTFVTPSHVLLSGVSCVAPGASVGLDIVAGLAGPERVMLDASLRRVFAGEIAEEEASRHPKRTRK